jgi:hypothetical protein
VSKALGTAFSPKFPAHPTPRRLPVHVLGGAQEAKTRLNVPLQENFHVGILKGVRNISETFEKNGVKFLLRRANGKFLAS